MVHTRLRPFGDEDGGRFYSQPVHSAPTLHFTPRPKSALRSALLRLTTPRLSEWEPDYGVSGVLQRDLNKPERGLGKRLSFL